MEGAVEYTGGEFVGPDHPVLEEDALQGLAGDCVSAIAPLTEAASVAVLLSMLLGFGNLVHQGAYVRIGPVKFESRLREGGSQDT